jgi:inosine-uridine nucleoside N-ribohydrolase
VYRGASRPLSAPCADASGVHGRNGLGGVQLPDAGKRIESGAAPDGIAELARRNPGLTIVALGPLTNVAVALNLYPELQESLGGVVSMGGALGRGNVTPYAEFNYYADPESVRAVLDSRVSLTVVTWDAALKMAHTEEQVRALGLEDGRCGRLLLEMHQPLFAYMEKTFGQRVATFPDPMAMAYAADPALSREQITGDLTVESTDSPRRGATTRRSGERVKLITEIDKVGFQSILLEIHNLA